MTPEEKRAVAAMMQRLAMFIAERRCLIQILMDSVRDAKVPTDWQRQLESMRQSREYHAILDEHAPVIRKLEEDADIEALLPLIEQLSKKLPN